MATSKETAAFILDKLGHDSFTVRRMFGEYALYAEGKTVGFICDETLFVKILPASAALAERCETGPAYPGSKPYYIVDEGLLDDPQFSQMLMAISVALTLTC